MNYLDLSIHSDNNNNNNNNLELGIYRKPTQTDRHTDRHTDRYTDRQTHRQTDRHIDRQIDRLYYTLYIHPLIRTQTRSVQLLPCKQNAIYTNHRTNKTTRMEHYLYHS